MADWREANPRGRVLSRETGHDRDYGRNPYAGYDNPDERPFFFDGETDSRLPPKTRVAGLGAGEDAVAITLDRLLADRVIEVEVGGEPVVVWVRPGVASALDASEVSQGREVGATAAFHPEAKDRRLHFTAAGKGFTDKETGSRWNLAGTAGSGPLKGATLRRAEHVDTFWFAWVAFTPETKIIK